MDKQNMMASMIKLSMKLTTIIFGSLWGFLSRKNWESLDIFYYVEGVISNPFK